MGKSFLKEPVAFKVFKIANVLAQKCVIAFGEANGVLQLTSYRKDRGSLSVKKNRSRDEPAGATKLLYFLNLRF